MVRPGRTGPVGAPAAGVAPETFARRSLIDRAWTSGAARAGVGRRRSMCRPRWW